MHIFCSYRSLGFLFPFCIQQQCVFFYRKFRVFCVLFFFFVFLAFRKITVDSRFALVVSEVSSRLFFPYQFCSRSSNLWKLRVRLWKVILLLLIRELLASRSQDFPTILRIFFARRNCVHFVALDCARQFHYNIFCSVLRTFLLLTFNNCAESAFWRVFFFFIRTATNSSVVNRCICAAGQTDCCQ